MDPGLGGSKGKLRPREKFRSLGVCVQACKGIKTMLRGGGGPRGEEGSSGRFDLVMQGRGSGSSPPGPRNPTRPCSGEKGPAMLGPQGGLPETFSPTSKGGKRWETKPAALPLPRAQAARTRAPRGPPKPPGTHSLTRGSSWAAAQQQWAGRGGAGLKTPRGVVSLATPTTL